MMKNIYSAVIFTLLISLSTSYALNPDSANQVLSKNTAQISDDIIKNNLQLLYSTNPLLNEFNLNISVKDQIATLDGAVRNRFQKELAEKIAANHQGIRCVKNLIVIDPHTRAGENTSAYAQQVVDATITAIIKSRLAITPGISASAIEVTTSNNIVALTGKAASATEKNEAGKVAINTCGVETVKNNLQVDD